MEMIELIDKLYHHRIQQPLHGGYRISWYQKEPCLELGMVFLRLV